MSKPKKARNKKYVPRLIAQHGGLVAIAMCHARGENASVLKPDQITDLGVAYWLSLENLRTGDANEESWSCVACALNVALVLCEKGIGAEYEKQLVTALDGAFRAKIRSAKSGNFRLDGEALRDIETALQIHDQQMSLAKRWEVTAAMQTIYKRLKDGNVYQEAVAGQER
jgi:Holliday junction resolvase